MKLKDFLNALPRGQKGVFAAKVGIDSVYLSQIASEDQGDRKFRPSPALAVRIEHASTGAVTRQDLRPEDWQEIWPELPQATAKTAQVATKTVPQGGIPPAQTGALRTGSVRRHANLRAQEELAERDRRAKEGTPFQGFVKGAA